MRLICLLVLLPAAASAVTLKVNGGTADVLVGADKCKTLQLVANWDLQQAPVGNDRVLIIGARSASTCTSTTPTSLPDQTFFNDPAVQTDSRTVSAADMTLSSDAGVSGCDDPSITSRNSSNPLTNVLCVQYQLSTLSGTSVAAASVNVKYALAKPLQARGLSVTPGDGHLRVFWSKGDDGEQIATWDVHVVPEGTTSDGGVSATTSGTSADVSQTDGKAPLKNDAGYSVYVVAHDIYGNVSDPSASVTGTPVNILDFYQLYREGGGTAGGGGGCSSAGTATWVAVLALAAGLLARRRRAAKKARDAALLLLGIALLAPAANAQLRYAERSPRRFLIGFKIDRYDPQIDSEPAFSALPAAQRPYFQIFHGRAPLRYQLEVDWEVAHPFGSILLGVTAGFWQNYGKGLVTSTRQPSGDTALLNVWPLGIVATYRFDWLADRWARFPFIPYAQAGISRTLWVSYSGSGSVSKDATRGGRGSGWTWGYTTALGVALNLDALDPELAREAYVDFGLQRTTLFAEYGWTRLDGFRGGDSLILSDRAWRFGLAVEF